LDVKLLRLQRSAPSGDMYDPFGQEKGPETVGEGDVTPTKI
jgi:hypothetical protein